jgi:hypothetical protein
MAALTEQVLVEELGLSFDDVPPCEMLVNVNPVEEHCDLPAAARIHVTCACGRSRYLFLCAPHLKDVGAAQAVCKYCNGQDYTWREA